MKVKRPALSFPIALGAAMSILCSPAFAATAISKADQAHMASIENGILPEATTKDLLTRTSTLADRMSADKVPGISIAVFHNGRIAWARGYGVADAAGAPVTADTLFLAGSISKPVTAMAVLSLVQSGRLKLDTDVNQYLKTWKVPANSFTEHAPVTLRELLSHTAGMTVHGFRGYAQGEKVPTLVQVLNGEKPANSPPIRVDTTPGTVWRYSGGGYVVTQQLLEDVSGRPFAAIAQDAVLGPAGMTSSTFVQPVPAARASKTATPFDQNGKPIKGGAYTYPELAPAGLWTTPSDLARYAIALHRALSGAPQKMIRKDLAQAMVRPGGLGGWGLGWLVGGDPAHLHFEHSGADTGFQANLVAYDSGDGVAIMTNSDNGSRLIAEVLRTVAHEYGWPDYGPVERISVALDPAVSDGYVGSYRIGRFSFITIARNGDKVVAKGAGPGDQELLPASARDWFYRDADVRVSFDDAPAKRPSKLTVHQGGLDTVAVRVSDAEARKSLDELAAKVKAQSQDPLSEAALRRLLDELKRGRPDYGRMSPTLAAATRQQLPALSSGTAALGPVRAIAFKGVGPAGADIYEVSFEGGMKFEARIILDAHDIIETCGLRALPS